MSYQKSTIADNSHACGYVAPERKPEFKLGDRVLAIGYNQRITGKLVKITPSLLTIESLPDKKGKRTEWEAPPVIVTLLFREVINENII